MSLDTKWLEDFLALAELRHFSNAAKARHITQPAFGRHIKALETAVGKTLVDRNTSPISLTPAGKQFRTVARNIIDQMDQGLQLLNNSNQPLLQPVRIASPHSLASPTLMDLIDSINAGDNPLPCAVDILRVDDAAEALGEGSCDFMIGFEILAMLQPPFQNQFLGAGSFLLVSATDENNRPLFNLDSPSIPFIRYSPDSYSARLIEQYQPSIDTSTLLPVFESSMCQLHKEMVMRGKGIAWLPDCLIKEELKTGKLISLESQRLHVPYQVRLYRNSGVLHKDAEQFWLALSNKVNSGWQLLSHLQ